MNDIYTIKEFQKKNRKKHLIFICDHASNFIPKKYNSLGLSKKYIASHIAYDIGAREFCIEITKLLEQSCFLANFSRLLIDPNRDENSSELILSSSAGIKIPGNFEIKCEEKKLRLKKFHQEYHCNLAKFVKEKKKKIQKNFSHINSFVYKKNWKREKRN